MQVRCATMLEEAYRRAVKAFNDRDLDAWVEMMDPEISIESRFTQLSENYFHGHRAMKRWWDDLGDAWEYLQVEPSEVREVAPDETLALVHLSGKGRESGVVVREPTAHRVKWRAGRWTSLRYVDRADAERELSG